MHDLPVKVLPFWPGINLSYTAKWEWYVKLTNLLPTCLLLFVEVLTHLLSSLIWAMCFSAVPPSSSSSTSVMFGSEWRSVCAEGEMNVQEIMDALHVALIPSPDSQTSFPPSPDLKFLLASKLGVNICNKTTHLYIVSVLNAHCMWHGNEGYNWGPRMGMRLHVGYHSAPMPGITCNAYSNQ